MTRRRGSCSLLPLPPLPPHQLGKGTEALDATALAGACLEQLCAMDVKCLFASHLHLLHSLDMNRCVCWRGGGACPAWAAVCRSIAACRRNLLVAS
jgi:hypothetical protein